MIGEVRAVTWQRPVPLIGDRTSAAERAQDPRAWAFPLEARQSLHEVITARRDVRRYRPDAVDDEVLERVLRAGHAAPSVGHSQPWRFIVVTDPAIRERAAWMSDRARMAQAAALEPEAARHLLDLQLEGIREAPIGVVVCCDRRVTPAGVLGRATFADADIWSCICAIENMWLAARAEGLGLGWVTLFEPDELDALVALPAGIMSLGWLCLGWPDERPPEPGLERAGWSRRLDLEHVVLHDRWPAEQDAPAPPASKLRAPTPADVVAARDGADELLTPSGSLGILDRAVDRALALGSGDVRGGTLVLAAGRHPVALLGVSTFDASVTDEVLSAARAGEAMGSVAAAAAGLDVVVIDAGASSGNLRDAPALLPAEVTRLVDQGRVLGRELGDRGVVALGEVGIGNTTVAAVLTSMLLGLPADEVVGLGAGADTSTVERKRELVTAAVGRCRRSHGDAAGDPMHALACGGGPEFAFLAGVVLGAASAGTMVILDGLATSVAAMLAAIGEPGILGHLIAGHRSREPAHVAVLERLGIEPLLDLRIRSGEGVGAALAARLLFHALDVRQQVGRTSQRHR